MAKQGIIEIDMQANTARLQSDFKKATAALNSSAAQMKLSLASVEKSFKKFDNAISGIGAGIAGIASIAAVSIGTGLVREFTQAERQAKVLASALNATGRSSGFEPLIENATRLQRELAIDGDALTEATGRLAAFNKSLSTEELKRSQTAIVSLASALHIDLSSAAFMVEKSLGGTMNMLGRYGIHLDLTKDAHGRLNQIMEKTATMLDVAKGEANTTEGQVAGLTQSWGDLQESMGQVIAEGLDLNGSLRGTTNTLNESTDAIQANKDEWVRWVQGFKAVISTVLNGAGLVTAGFVGIAGTVSTALSEAFNLLSIGINNMLKTSIEGYNNFIQFMNKNPINQFISGGRQLPKAQLMQLPTQPFGRADASIGDWGFKTAGWFGKNLANDWSALGKPIPRVNTGNRANPSLDDQDHGSGSGKSKKHKKTEAEKEMDRLKSEAESLKQAMRNIWEVEAAEIAKANKLLKMHLIDQKTYNRAIIEAKNNAKEAFKIEGVEDAVKKFMEPHKKFLEAFDSGLGDALGDTGFQEVQRIIEGTLTPLEKYNQSVDYLKYAYENLGLPQENFNRALTQAQKDYEEATNKGNDFAQAIGNITAEFGDKFFDTVTSGFQGAKLSMSDFISSALMDLSKLIFKLTVTLPLANALTKALGGNTSNQSSGINLFSLVKGVFGGARADGGPVSGDKTYLVGERGPELFVPKSDGAILPNHKLGGGQTVIYSQPVFHISTGVKETVRAEVMGLMPQIEKRTTSAVKTAIGRGGSMSAAVGRKS